MSLPGGKESACNTGDPGPIPESEDSQEDEMTTHSSILGWEIPAQKSLVGLQSMGLQKAGHN